MRWPSWEMKQRAFEALKYQPTEAQVPIHKSEASIIIVGGGERGGKSYVAAKEAVVRLPVCAGYPILLVGEKYERCVPEFDYISDDLLTLGLTKAELISRPADGQQRCTIRVPHLDIKIMTVSAVKGMTAVRATGLAPKLILLCEGALLPYGVFLASLGRVAEAKGAVIATGTFPDDTGWYAQKYEEYQGPNDEGGQSFSMPSWSNTKIYPGGENDAEIQKLRARYPHLDFLRFIGAEPQPPATLVYPEFRYSRHVQEWVKFDENEPVWLAIDPGYRGAYAVLAVQFIDRYVHVIDEVYRWGAVHGEEAYGEAIIEECMRREWWDNVADGVIDIAGLQHQAAQSQVELWAAKTEIALKWRQVPEWAGIQRLRTFLIDPASGEVLLLLSTLAPNTAKEFTLWRYREVVEGRPVSESPIDRDNHAIKALIYLLYYLFGPVDWEMEEIEKVRSPWKEVYGKRKKKDFRRYGE